MGHDRHYCLLGSLLLGELLQVELQLRSFEDVSVRTTDLAGTRDDLAQQLTSAEHVTQDRVQLVTLAGLQDGLLLLLGQSAEVSLLLLGSAERFVVLLLVEALERSSINLHDGTLDQSLGTGQLAVGSVVHNIEDTALATVTLATPGEVTTAQLQSAELVVTTTDADRSDDGISLDGQLGVGSSTSELELSLLTVDLLLGTSGSSLMQVALCDTYSRMDV